MDISSYMKFIQNLRKTIWSSAMSNGLRGGIFLVVIGSFSASALSFVGAALSARGLGKELFGQLAFMQTLVISLGSVLGYGLGSLNLRFGAQIKVIFDQNKLKSMINIGKVSIVTSIASVLLLFAAALYNFTVIPIWAVNLNLYIICITALPFYCLDAVLRSSLLGFGKYGAYSIIPIIGYFPYILSIVLSDDLTQIALGWLLMSVINSFISLGMFVRIFFRSMPLSSANPENGPTKDLISTTDWLPAIISSALVAPVQWLANLLMVNQSGSFEATATYVVAMQWFALLCFVPNAINRAFSPRISSTYFQNDLPKLRKEMRWMLAYSLACILVPALFIYIFKDIILGLYGTEFLADTDSLNFTIFAGLAAVVASPVGCLMLAARRLWLGAILNGSWAFVFLSGTFLGAKYGVIWVLGSISVAYGIQALICWVLIAPSILRKSELASRVDCFQYDS